MKRSVPVEIGGHRLTIRSDEQPEYVHELADYIDGHLREIAAQGGSTTPHRVALMVCMQLADELFRARDLHQRFSAKVEARLKMIDAALAEHERCIDEYSSAKS